MPSPSVTVIVTAKNEEQTVGRCLYALLSQDYPDYQILFVDAGSQDDTLNIARSKAVEDSRLRVIEYNGNPSQCRNVAVNSCNSDVVAFTDADVEVPPTWLRSSVEALFSGSDIGGVGGPNIPTRQHSGNLIATVDLMLTTSLGSMRSAQSYDFKDRTTVKSIPCCNATYRRELLVRIGGFDEELVGCDDTDLGYRMTRAGTKLLFDPQVSVLHSVKFGTLRQFAKLMFKYGRGRGYAVKKKSYLFSGPAIPAVGLLLGVPVVIITAGVSLSVMPLAVLTISYLVIIVVYSAAVGFSRKDPKAALIGPIVLTAEYASYFAGFVAGLVDRRSSRWSS